jgi:small-conductance mechanosensitive channel
VLPNSVAASQVIINLTASQPHAAAPLSINIHVSQQSDLAAARELALRTARQALGEAAVIGCFLTRMDDSGATLELRLRAPAGAERDAARSKLLEQLARGFAASGLTPAQGKGASFS